MFLWLFVIPLIIFVVAYWKILAVVRRQAKVAADRHRSTKTSNVPVAGPSRGTITVDTSNATLSTAGNQRNEMVMKGAVKAGERERGRIGNQQGTTGRSKATMNVIRTMIYITVCFTLCWMPLYFYLLFKKVTVRQISCFNISAYLTVKSNPIEIT